MASLGGSGGSVASRFDSVANRWLCVVTAVAIPIFTETPDGSVAFNPCCSVVFVVVLKSMSLFMDAERR